MTSKHGKVYIASMNMRGKWAPLPEGFKRINVRKLISLKEFSNKSFSNIVLEISNYDNLEKLSHLIGTKGDTNVKIKVKSDNKDLVFELADKRKINKDILKILKKEPYLKRISY